MTTKGFALFLLLFFCSPNGILAYVTKGINYPSLYQFASESLSVKIADDKNEKIAIFKDDVHFEFKGVAEFFAEKIRVGFSKDGKIKYFDMIGNVTMQKGALRISSTKAYTDNLHSHIDFWGKTVISRNEIAINTMGIRYDFLKNTFFAF